ncbi:nuclear transport factor 2 family protein [Lysobacter sp. K5869]|uniref:nuclear transport factor 2 family protein n=1 Tax=Lysobacter sp. K5869 TaxID=2820808 RepID=UPI001C060B14|nr:nuclear transport factor 2 family protein [Lysobacter sp. K5869]QWP78219.1 nuclear transport factor 2 family protein [Lysobacter sp. K5869]
MSAPATRTAWAVAVAIAAISSAGVAKEPSAAAPQALPEGQALTDRVAGLDTQLFDSFNRCADPEQFARHAALFDENVEFYHDVGGVTWTREKMLENTRRNVCGKIRRELVQGSLRVYPLPGFGAMEIGEHRFCAPDGGACQGRGEFVMLWRYEGDQWRVTRVLSYAHRAEAKNE